MRKQSICVGILFALLSGLAFQAPALAQDCALSVEASKSGKTIEYQQRNNRCEGSFRQKVSGRVNLRVVGYHHNRLTADIETDENILIHVIGASSAPTRLTVVSLRPDDFYQMDTLSLDDNGGYTWPTDILRQIDFPPSARHLAAVGCAEGCDGYAKQTPLLNPIIFGSKDATADDDSATVLVMADVELKSLEYALEIEGQEAPIESKIARPFIPAKRAQKIIISDLNGGRAKLTLRGVTHTGRQAYYEAMLLPVLSAQ